MNKFSLSEIRAAVQALQHEAERFLCDLIRFPSLPGKEQEAMECAAQRFAEVGEVERIPLTNALREDKDYADPMPGIAYEGRSNLRVHVAGTDGGRSLLFNTHLDVVPPSEGQEHPFEPSVEANRAHGRGSCSRWNSRTGTMPTSWMRGTRWSPVFKRAAGKPARLAR
jgi:acetylornithine deacetylase/succinyl-diaminopimelate desuccinylase-like protein